MRPMGGIGSHMGVSTRSSNSVIDPTFALSALGGARWCSVALEVERIRP